MMFHIIDDEIMLRELLSCLVSSAGYHSLSFESGEKYLEYLHSPEYKPPISVLSDVTMPGINGYDLALKVRNLLPKQMITLITGYADPEHHVEAARQVCHTIEKPYKPKRLIAMLDALAACHKSHTTDAQSEYPRKCIIDHASDCPFCPHDQLSQ